MVERKNSPEDELHESDLKSVYQGFLHEELEPVCSFSETNVELTNFALNNISIADDGRLVLPALWNKKVEHLLPNNFNLSSNLLHSITNKLSDDKITLYNNAIKQQIEEGIIVPVDDLAQLKKDKTVSFLPHNAVFKPNAESTKCRIVLMSNLCEKRRGNSLSHNQISLPGPQLNSKLFLTLTLYRFNKYLIICDIIRAFLQFYLREQDTNKLHLLWFKDYDSGDKREAAYKYTRVPMGLRFSPFLLMIALFFILVHTMTDCTDSSLFKMIYNLAYMDNIAFSSNDKTEALNGIKKLADLFQKYSLGLQKFNSNFKVPLSYSEVTSIKVNAENSDTCNLFGVDWCRTSDSLKPKVSSLNVEAKTRRQILCSLNSNFDPLGIILPTLNRAKVFLHELIVDDDIGWDDEISENKLKEWRNIAIQFNQNATKVELSVPRFVGKYEDTFNLIACVDASKAMYGVVIYIKCNKTDKISFLLAKNKIVSKSLDGKSIPILELLACQFGVECLIDVRSELSGACCPVQINELHLYTDSMICLSWIQSKTVKFSKIEKKSALINNKLDKIVKSCDIFPVVFHHIDGVLNPSDFVTRPVSAKLLIESNYLAGPSFSLFDDYVTFTVPISSSVPCNLCMNIEIVHVDKMVFDFTKYSSFNKTCRVFHWVKLYIHKLKLKVRSRNESMFIKERECSYLDNVNAVLRNDQLIHFPDVFDYFKDPNAACPQVVSQLNLIIDKDLLIRVKGKMDRHDSYVGSKYPILLSKHSDMVGAIVSDYHLDMHHASTYKVLNQIRKEFHIPHAYNTIRKILKPCINCKKINGRTVNINQNSYRPDRVNPSQRPFGDIALDHIGPFCVRYIHGSLVKVYLLIVTCLYSRAINLIICHNINNKSFLQALQTHVHDYGIFKSVLSDNGSPIVSSLNQIGKYLRSVELTNYLKERNIKLLEFNPYPPGASYLGGVVESLVKQVKHLIYSSISRNVLQFDEFSFLVSESKMLINKRPIAYKRGLTDLSSYMTVLTPEILIKGYDVPSLSILPQMDCEDRDFSTDIDPNRKQLFDSFEALRASKLKLNELYYDEFIQNLRDQSINKKDRYDHKDNVKLEKGDLVLIRQELIKPYFHPMAIVEELDTNSMGEVVSVVVRKGNKERVRRHVTDLVLLDRSVHDYREEKIPIIVEPQKRPKRQAAYRCRDRLNKLRDENLN